MSGILYLSFLHDKPLIEAQQQEQQAHQINLTPDQAIKGAKDFLNNTMQSTNVQENLTGGK